MKDRYAQLRTAAVKTLPKRPGDDVCLAAWKRRLSIKIAERMRNEGLLVEEGYAPGSWAAP